VAATPAARRADVEHHVRTLLASGHYNLGVIAAQQKQSVAAAAQFEAATAADPMFPHAVEGLGVAWFTAGQFDRAQPALTRALERDGGNAVLRRMVALSAFQLDDWPRAAGLLADDPQRLVDPALQFTFGVALVRSGRADEATAAFRQLLAANADSAEVNVVLGLAYAQQGDFDAATTALRHALQIKPDIPQAHATLGTMALKRGELTEAERALRAELAIQPSDSRTRQVLAVVLDLEGRPADALRELRTVIEARPAFSDAQYTMGKILLAQGETAEALGHLETAARLAPGDANVHYQLAQAYQRAGRTELAREQFDAFRSLKDARRGDPR
jgi:Flp pilus assembly protein TadD